MTASAHQVAEKFSKSSPRSVAQNSAEKASAPSLWQTSQLSRFSQMNKLQHFKARNAPTTHFRRPEHVTEARVEAALYSASCKSSVGPDKTSTSMLRALWENGYKHVLLSLLRQCYLQLPDFLKEAWLSPIPKPTGGFRPISLTLTLEKSWNVSWRMNSLPTC